METESLEQQPTRERSLSEDRDVPETFPGHEALPSVYRLQIIINNSYSNSQYKQFKFLIYV